MLEIINQFGIISSRIAFCTEYMFVFLSDGTDPARCPMDFDGISCWPQSKPNTTVFITCPGYINLFNYSGKVVLQTLIFA